MEAMMSTFNTHPSNNTPRPFDRLRANLADKQSVNSKIRSTQSPRTFRARAARPHQLLHDAEGKRAINIVFILGKHLIE